MGAEAIVDPDLLFRFLVALGVGGLIGLERERHHAEKTIVAGIRTMSIVALSGVVIVRLVEATGAVLLYPAALLVVGGLAGLMFYARRHEKDPGLTTPVTFLAVFLLGLLAGVGLLFLAVLVGLGITFLLFYKTYLHKMADFLTEEELRGALYFGVFAFILYPIAPNEAVDPWGVVNPRQVLLIVVLVSGLTFLGFLVMRRFGARRGLPLTGLLGGLVSSVAAAAALASLPGDSKRMRRGVAQGILLAATSMLGRNLAVAVIADPSLQLVRWIAPPLAAIAAWFVLVTMTSKAIPGEPGSDGDDEMTADIRETIRSPFAIRPALYFGFLFVLLSVAAFLLQRIPGIGSAGVYLTALGGLVSSGAVVASMALLVAQGSIEIDVAARAALLAVMVSLGVKIGIAQRGGRAVARSVGIPMGAAAVVLLLYVLVTMAGPALGFG